MIKIYNLIINNYILLMYFKLLINFKFILQILLKKTH
jgi:hypothetical protein